MFDMDMKKSHNVPVLENSSAGFGNLMAIGGHAANRHQSRRFFCVRCMAAPYGQTMREVERPAGS